MRSPMYKRYNQHWAQLLQKTGVVTAVTTVRVAAPELSHLTPYSYLIVKTGDSQIECMGAAQETFVIGDLVRFVLRKMGETPDSEPLAYGVKATKV
jgi:uncharacterized OB-fold protein